MKNDMRLIRFHVVDCLSLGEIPVANGQRMRGRAGRGEGSEGHSPGKAHHPLRQTDLAQPFIPLIVGVLGLVGDRRTLAALQPIGSGSIEDDLVLERLVGRSEQRVVDGKEAQLRGDYRSRVTLWHRIAKL